MAASNLNDRLIFIELPDGVQKAVEARPPMISALQGFETALLLLAQTRYPQALVTMTSAIESACKAHLGLGPEDRQDLSQLAPELNRQLTEGKYLPLSDLKKLRETRNRLTHYGFMPADDEISITLFFRTALPFFENILEHSAGFSVISRLPPDLTLRISDALEFNRSKTERKISAIDSIRGVNHWITRATRHWYLTWWEFETLEADSSSLGTAMVSGFDLKEKRKSTLLDTNTSISLECPICGAYDAFVVAIDDEALDQHQLKPMHGSCVECSLKIPGSASALLSALCKDQLTDELKAQTIKEYGVK